MQFFGLFNTSIRAPRREPRFVRSHASALKILLEQGETRNNLSLEFLFRTLAVEEIIELRNQPPPAPHGSKLLQKKLVHETRQPPPALRLVLERFLPRSGNRVIFRIAIILSLVPRALDPSLLLESDQSR